MRRSLTPGDGRYVLGKPSVSVPSWPQALGQAQLLHLQFIQERETVPTAFLSSPEAAFKPHLQLQEGKLLINPGQHPSGQEQVTLQDKAMS